MFNAIFDSETSKSEMCEGVKISEKNLSQNFIEISNFFLTHSSNRIWIEWGERPTAE